MALTSPYERVSILGRLGKMLKVHYEDALDDPLPQRWVDLIKYLNAKEQAQPEALQLDDAPEVRRTRSH